MKIWLSKKKNTFEFLQECYWDAYNRTLDLKRIHEGKNGKPYDKNQEFFFNISHTKHYIICVISSAEVGIDMEETRILTPSLIKYMGLEESIPDPLDIWVLKEAYVKYTGEGLRRRLDSFTVEEIEEQVEVKKIDIKDLWIYVVGNGIIEEINNQI